MPNPEAREEAWRKARSSAPAYVGPASAGYGFQEGWDARGRYDEQRIAELVEGLERAMQLLAYGNFKNGNTDPTGTLDEGEVLAGRMYDELRNLLGQSEEVKP